MLEKIRENKVGKFVKGITLAAAEVYLIKNPHVGFAVACARQFHSCFLVADEEDRETLKEEASKLSEPEIEKFAKALAKPINKALPERVNSEEAIQATKRLIKTLGSINTKGNAKQLAQSISDSMNVAEDFESPANRRHFRDRSIGRALAKSLILTSAQELKRPSKPPQLKDWECLRCLGHGAFSRVFLAKNKTTPSQVVALKVGKLAEPGRFKREVAILNKVEHQHIVRFFGSGEEGGWFWIAMENLGGTTLGNLLELPDGLDAEQAILLGRQVAEGLNALHQAGVVHRDLKPENILIDFEYNARLTDFGLSQVQGKLDVSRLSMTGQLMGTPAFMSPEQVKGEKVTPQLDIWAFGILLYNMFTGETPYQAKTIMSLGSEILSKSIDCDLEKIPPEFAPFIKRCLSKDPGQRPKAGVDFLNEFKDLAGRGLSRLVQTRNQAVWAEIIKDQVIEKYIAKPGKLFHSDAEVEFLRFLEDRGLSYLNEEKTSRLFEDLKNSAVQRSELNDRVKRFRSKLVAEGEDLSSEALENLVSDLKGLEGEERDCKESQTSLLRVYGIKAGWAGSSEELLAEVSLAEQGDAKAQFKLGEMYESGRGGVPEDDEAAVQWYRRAAEQGHAEAQNNLGEMYYYGQGVAKDYKAAVQWYRRAAEQGHAWAQFNLGWMYEKGCGVAQDKKAAVQWYRRAAEQGHAEAQRKLGEMYEAGCGVAKDYVYAYMWAYLAASSGHDWADGRRNRIEKKMTPSQIKKAKKLAREYVPKPEKD